MAVTAQDVGALRPGQRVHVTYTCGASLTSALRPAGPRLVLDIPGDHFVVRRADGSPARDIASLTVVDDA